MEQQQQQRQQEQQEQQQEQQKRERYEYEEDEELDVEEESERPVLPSRPPLSHISSTFANVRLETIQEFIPPSMMETASALALTAVDTNNNALANEDDDAGVGVVDACTSNRTESSSAHEDDSARSDSSLDIIIPKVILFRFLYNMSRRLIWLKLVLE